MIGLGAFGNVDGGLASLCKKAERPARALGSAFLLAILKGRSALGVFLAVSPLAGALLFNALFGISVTVGSKLNGRCSQ